MKDIKDDIILMWLDVFSRPDSSFRGVTSAEELRKWQPQSALEKEAFAGLTAPEHRELLKAWYSQFQSLNQTADDFHLILERATGEQLPLSK